MENYKFLKKGFFESINTFEEKLNQKVREGWKVINFTNDRHSLIVLLERIK